MASMPSRSERLAAATKASRTRARPAASNANGGVSASLCGIAEGPSGRQPPSANWDQLAAVPRRVARCLAAGVRELDHHSCLRALAHRGQDRLQRGLGGVVVEAETAGRDAADRLDRRGLDAEDRSARQRQRIDVREVPVIGLAIHGRILAHRRHHDAVGKVKAAQLDRGKQSAHGLRDPDRRESNP